MSSERPRTAIWALTPKGVRLARAMARKLDDCTLFLPEKAAAETDDAEDAVFFPGLKDEVAKRFAGFSRHIFIMAAGIVVRSIAAHLVHKTSDPAVVVCDEAGEYAVSLISGHIGGANTLAREVARLTGSQAVITTGTDVNRVPAIDLIAKENRLAIENPDAIKTVNMALISGTPIRVYDPGGRVVPQLPGNQLIQTAADGFSGDRAGIFVDYIRLDLPPRVLVLRPASLVAGMGCNRGTSADEMRGLLVETFAGSRLTMRSLRALATVDVKADEAGLLELADALAVPLIVFTRDRLQAVGRVPTPSAMVEKHIGVKSVCEAAALLATHRGRLIVPKRKTANATLAVAADGCISSASDPAARST